MVAIYAGLIPGKNDLDQISLLGSSNTYAISRTWVTSFKVYVEKKVNSLSKPSGEKKSNCGGIDSLNLSAAMEDDVASQNSGTTYCSMNETIDPFKEEDPTSKISCERANLAFFVAIYRHFCHLFIMNAYHNPNSITRQAWSLPYDAQPSKCEAHL